MFTPTKSRGKIFVNSDFSDLLSLFNANRVNYLVIGGYAVIQYGEPRFTKDLDIWIQADPANAAAVYQALKAFGAPLCRKDYPICHFIPSSIEAGLKILHIYKDYYPVLGGIENHIKQLAEAQAAARHEVTVLVTNPDYQPKHVRMNEVNLVRAWRVATAASTPLSPELPLAVRRIKADIAHLHSPYPVAELSEWLLGGKRPYLITYHSDVIKQQSILRFYRPFLRRVLAGAARILVSNRNYIESSDYLRPFAHKCTVIPFAVDLERFENALPLVAATAVPTLLFVGQHRYYKGVDDLLRAMPWLNARLLIGGDGPQRAEWQNLAHELDVADKVQFLGRIADDDLPRFYASGDVFVLPSNSRAESFGMVLQEAMAAGLPCVTTELGTGTSWLVQDGLSGFVVPPKEPAALTAVLNTLLTQPQLRQQMGQAGQQRARTEFTLAQMVERVEAVYREVIGKR